MCIYVHAFYTCTTLYSTYTVCIYIYIYIYIYNVCLSLKVPLSGPQNQYLLHNGHYNIAENVLHTHTFFKLFPTTAVQQRQHVDVVNCCKFFSRPIGVSVFDILQIHSGFSQICSGCIAFTCIPLATDLLTLWYSAAINGINLTNQQCKNSNKFQ